MSYLNFPKKYLYIHVPKAAGSSMESIVGGGGHQPAWFFMRFIKLSSTGYDWDKFYKFAFVRNPYTRFVSAVTAHYMGRSKQAETTKKCDLTREGFYRFIVNNFKKIKNLGDPPGEWIHLIPQYKFIHVYRNQDKGLGWEGNLLDFVGRYENLKADWKVVANKLGFNKPLPHIRKNTFQDYEKLWSDNARKIVYDLYREDFELFNYPQ